jgi:type IX secretion system PorP/SprF family membrane protein
MRKALVTIVSVFSFFVSVSGQDAYFTQFYANPLELNPALSGAMEGTYRVSISYRDQWSGLVDNPYKTFGLYGDMRFEVGKKGQDYVGGGIAFLSDKVSAFDFNTLGIKLSGAFHKNLDVRTKQYLSGGAFLGITQKNVNVQQLSFDDQFNGLNGYTFSTKEIFPDNNFGFFDLGMGINYAISPTDKTQYTIGGSVAHLSNPSASFGARTEGIAVPDIKLYSRWTGYVSASFELSDPVRILPRFSIISQGPYLLMNIGTNVRLEINDHNSNAVQFGLGLRMARDIEKLTPSAMYLAAGIELGNFIFGLSYDFNLDDLTNERLGQGVMEFNVTYIGEYDNTSSFCPTF